MLKTFENLLVYSPDYQTDLNKYGVKKDFALDRGARVLKQLEQDHGAPIPYLVPNKIPIADILLVHQKEYLESLKEPTTWLSIFEFKESEYEPSSAAMPLNMILEDFRIKTGGTKLASTNALDHGLTANLGGGYHHAFPDQGRGYCAINDIAISIRSLQRDKKIKTAMIIDLDFHQGDGNALIFKNDQSVFTLSVHSKEGWPDQKQKSDIDVNIPEGEENTYLERTEQAIEKALSSLTPDLVFFVAGSDPYEKDILPGTKLLKLSLDQMKERDKLVIDKFHNLGIPLTIVFAGGYGPHVWEVHYHAIKHLLTRQSERSAQVK